MTTQTARLFVVIFMLPKMETCYTANEHLLQLSMFLQIMLIGDQHFHIHLVKYRVSIRSLYDGSQEDNQDKAERSEKEREHRKKEGVGSKEVLACECLPRSEDTRYQIWWSECCIYWSSCWYKQMVNHYAQKKHAWRKNLWIQLLYHNVQFYFLLYL